MTVPWLSLVIFLPLIGVLVLAFVPRDRIGLIKGIALGTALLTFAASLAVVAQFEPTPPASSSRNRSTGSRPSASPTPSASTASRWRWWC